MRTFPDNSIDTVITDPPYGIGFMGKEWDNFDPTAVERATKKSSRKNSYLNPNRSKDARSGASPALEAGRYNRSLQGQIGFQEWFRPIFVEMLRITKPGGTMLVFGGARTYHRVVCAAEEAGWQLKDCIMWLYGSGFPKATDISKQLDKGHEREVIGKTKAGSKARNGYKGDMAIMPFETETIDLDVTAPATPEAKLWNGWKSHGLKPAYEPILVVMKPNDGTYAQNALKHGVSGLNIDGGRIGYEDKSEIDLINKRSGRATNGKIYGKFEEGFKGYADNQGRFPANVILDEHTAQNAGEWSRYFYCAKASKAERNAGCEGLEEKQTTGGGGMNNTEDDVCGKYRSIKSAGHNHHPTVKPLALMQYLCTLTKTPTGGIVLDPFAGSGTTLLAAKNIGRPYIGIEKEEEYVNIAEARLLD